MPGGIAHDRVVLLELDVAVVIREGWNLAASGSGDAQVGWRGAGNQPVEAVVPVTRLNLWLAVERRRDCGGNEDVDADREPGCRFRAKPIRKLIPGGDRWRRGSRSGFDAMAEEGKRERQHRDQDYEMRVCPARVARSIPHCVVQPEHAAEPCLLLRVRCGRQAPRTISVESSSTRRIHAPHSVPLRPAGRRTNRSGKTRHDFCFFLVSRGVRQYIRANLHMNPPKQ